MYRYVCTTGNYYKDYLLLKGPETQSTSSKWSRPPPPALNPKTDSLTFQQIEVDHYTGKFKAKLSWRTVEQILFFHGLFIVIYSLIIIIIVICIIC